MSPSERGSARRVALVLWAIAAIVLAIVWERAAAARQDPPPWVLLLFLPVFAGGFLLTLERLAQESGWTAMAERYRARTRPEGRSLSGQVVRIGSVPEGGITCLTIAQEGLYLRTTPAFAFRRPALLIPWRDVHWVRERRNFPWRRVYELDLGGISSIQIKKKAYEALAARVPQPGTGAPFSLPGVPPPPIE